MEYRQPKTLFNSAAEVLGINIILQAIEILNKWCTMSISDIEDSKMLVQKTIEYFDSAIPRTLHDIVTNKALLFLDFRFHWIFGVIKPECSISCILLAYFNFNSYQLAVHSALSKALFKSSPRLEDLHIERSFLNVCLRSHLAEFSFPNWSYEMQNALFRSLSLLKNLKRLNLTSMRLHENYTYVLTAIQDMKYLEIFKCFDCTTDMLKVVSDNCPLRKLNINFSGDITDTSLTSVLKLQNLRRLDILRTNFTEESIIEILLGLPHLTAISTTLLPSTLAKITDSNIKFPLLKVKYLHCTQEDLVNLTKYCPLLTKLNIYGRRGINFSTLSELKHLKILMIFVNVLHYDHIKTLIQSIGHQITKLVLHELHDRSISMENEIKSLCPNLKHFFLDRREEYNLV